MKICLYTICKNEIKNIQHWFDIMGEADYICLLDTGSTDGTWEYLQEKTKEYKNLIISQKIYKNFRFDIARNDSLKLIPDDVDYCLMMDIDETFQDKGWLSVLKKYCYGKNFNYARIHYTEGNRYFLKDKQHMITEERLHDKSFYWKFPVYECITTDTEHKLEVLPPIPEIIIRHNPIYSDNRNLYSSLSKLRIEENEDDIIGYALYLFENKNITEDFINLVIERINNNKFKNSRYISCLCLPIALYYENKNNYNLSKEFYEKGIQINENDFFIHYYASEFYKKHNEIERCKEISKNALDNMYFLDNPNDETFWFLRNYFINNIEF